MNILHKIGIWLGTWLIFLGSILNPQLTPPKCVLYWNAGHTQVSCFILGTGKKLGTITTTSGFNYPTATTTYNDGDIVNAGDFNSLFNYVGTKNSTDTTSVSYKAENPNVANATGSLSVMANTTGQVPVNKGGTGTNTIPSYNQVIIGNNSSGYNLSGAIPDCTNASTSKLLFTSSTQSWSCGTDQVSLSALPSSSSTQATTTLVGGSSTTTLHWILPTPRISSLYIFTLNQSLPNNVVTTTISISSSTISTCNASTNQVAVQITLQMINSTSSQGRMAWDLAGNLCNSSGTLSIPMGNSPILEVVAQDSIGGAYTVNGTYTFIP